jgi:peroxiredoxin
MATRLSLPFPVLSDEGLQFARALDLPTFRYGDWILLKRHTLVLRDGVIERVLYPVFPPDADAAHVLAWLKERP